MAIKDESIRHLQEAENPRNRAPLTRLGPFAFALVVVLLFAWVGGKHMAGPEEAKILLAGMFAKLTSLDSHSTDQAGGYVLRKSSLDSRGNCVSKLYQYNHGGKCGDEEGCLVHYALSSPGPNEEVQIVVEDVWTGDILFDGQVTNGGYFKIYDPSGFFDKGLHSITIYLNEQKLQRVILNSGCHEEPKGDEDEDAHMIQLKLVATATQPNLNIGPI